LERQTLEIDPKTYELLGRLLGAGMAVGLGGVGSAIGMGMSAAAANEGVMRQPERQGVLLRTMLIGQAVGGSPSIFALVVGLLILFIGAEIQFHMSYLAMLWGAGLAIGFGCFGSGLGCGWPGAAGCSGVARNPGQSSLITSQMIIGQAVAQSPAIFATVIALILLFVFKEAGFDWRMVGITLGAGLAMGAGAFGTGIGSGYTAGGAVQGMGRWPRNSGVTLRTMLVGQGVCQTPAIFAMLVAFIMLFTQAVEPTFIGFSKAMAAGIAVGFGGIGPGLGSGIVGDTACGYTAEKPRHEPLLLRTMLIGQAVSQSTAIYALIIALVILYVM
jgi:F0F1-type ATP synthase membrane subunit c/vacuolar-type H+-ATPase subunit K